MQVKPNPNAPPAPGQQVAQRQEDPVQQSELARSLMVPGKYECGDDDTFTIRVHTKQVDEGRWIIVDEKDPEAEHHEVIVRMWGFTLETEMRRNAMRYDRQERVHYTDFDALDQMKIRRLLVSWTFAKENDRLKLWHINNVLSDESWKAFCHIHRNILRYIVAQMNAVLEGNR